MTHSAVQTVVHKMTQFVVSRGLDCFPDPRRNLTPRVNLTNLISSTATGEWEVGAGMRV